MNRRIMNALAIERHGKIDHVTKTYKNLQSEGGREETEHRTAFGGKIPPMIEKALRREQDEIRIAGHGAQGRENRRAETLHISRDHLLGKELMFRRAPRSAPGGRVIDSSFGHSRLGFLEAVLQGGRACFRCAAMKYEFRVKLGVL